jgi:hypothetical protein
VVTSDWNEAVQHEDRPVSYEVLDFVDGYIIVRPLECKSSLQTTGSDSTLKEEICVWKNVCLTMSSNFDIPSVDDVTTCYYRFQGLFQS